MPHEGMVDALRRAIELLPPDGLLIDLHPTPDVAQLSLVQTDGTTELLGPLRSDTAVQRHTNADAAVAAAVAAHFLDRDSSAAFVFSRYCDSLDELVEQLSANGLRGSMKRRWRVRAGRCGLTASCA